MLIKDVIRNREPYSMKATASVMEAAEFMAGRRIGAACEVDCYPSAFIQAFRR